MAIVRFTLEPGTPLRPEQIARLDALKDRPIAYDEDCPPSTPEQLRKFRPANPEARAKWLASRNKTPA